MKLTKDEIRQKAELDLFSFAKLINPMRMYGSIHEEIFRWWQRSDAKDNQLVLLPRDHQKSHCLATRVAWYITNNPDVTILYVSATGALAEKQLYAIKGILTSDVYRRYWPLMVNKEESKRELWNVQEIAIDHPVRKREGIRDPTIKAVGLTSNVTGFHCNVACLDDVVVYENAYMKDGRDKVNTMYSLLASIETTDAQEWVVGTRYHPDDLYDTMLTMTEDVHDAEGDIIDDIPVYEVFEQVVEIDNEFLWPRKRRIDGKFFGFDLKQLARKKAKYSGRMSHFYAQYYNDPNDPGNFKIDPQKFNYYEREKLETQYGHYFFKQRKLNVIAAMDFAFTLGKRSDWCSVVVIGIDYEWNIFILDIIRFKTNQISVMFDKAMQACVKWGFRKMRVETTSGQEVIVNEFKQYMRREGVFFSLDPFKPNPHEERKEERIDSILMPRYDAQTIWHYKGGNCQVLEDELMVAHPDHDDCKDALAAAIDIARAPSSQMSIQRKSNIVYHPRFGGIAI